MVELGDKVRDSVSGFNGIAVSKHSYLQGCDRISVQPKIIKEGKLPESQTFDEPQLIVLQKRKIKKVEKISTKKPGGPMPYVPKSRDYDDRR